MIRVKMIEQEGEPKSTRGKKRSSETEDHQKQHLAILKRLKRGDENELERKLRLEKVVASKHLRFGHGDGRRKKSKTAIYVYKYSVDICV